MALPATLASHLKGRKWTPELNTEWIEAMLHTKRVFVVLHTRILAALNAKKFKAAYLAEDAKAKRMGKSIGATWTEVLNLLNKGYIFEPTAQVLLPGGLEASAYLEIMRKRMADH